MSEERNNQERLPLCPEDREGALAWYATATDSELLREVREIVAEFNGDDWICEGGNDEADAINRLLFVLFPEPSAVSGG